MQNDVLKNEIAPWQEKGRWYHAHFTENGIDIDNSDSIFNLKLIPTSGFLYSSDPNLIIIDYYIRINSVTSDGTIRTVQKQYAVRTDNTTRISIPTVSQYTKIDFDLYIYCNV